VKSKLSRKRIAIGVACLLVLLTAGLFVAAQRSVSALGEAFGYMVEEDTERLETLVLGSDTYDLFFDSGAAFTSRQWWVKKNGQRTARKDLELARKRYQELVHWRKKR